MSFRQPVRPLDKTSSEQKMPRELVVDFSTGDAAVINDSGSEVPINTLTLQTSGSGQAISSIAVNGRTIVANKDVNVPDVSMYVKVSDEDTPIETPELDPNTSAINSLTTRVGTAESEIDALQSGLSTTNNNLSTLQSTVSGLQTTLSSVQNTANAALPKSGGTMTGILKAQNNSSYTTGQVRNIFLSTAEPTASDGADGDIWLVYEA